MLHWRAEGKNSSKRENFNCVFPCGREVLGLFKNCAHAVHENWTNGNIVLYEQGQKRPHDSCSSPAPSRWRITRIWVPQRTQEILLASGYIKSPTPTPTVLPNSSIGWARRARGYILSRSTLVKETKTLQNQVMLSASTISGADRKRLFAKCARIGWRFALDPQPEPRSYKGSRRKKH